MSPAASCRVAAIVLAAGASRRMGEGRQKLLMPLDGRPLIAHVVTAACRSRVGEVLVVTGAHHDAIAAIFEDTAKVRLVRNPDPSRGMLSSVRCGLEALSNSTNGIAVLLGDQPGIDANVIDAVLNAWQAAEASIALPVCEGRRGHPLVFDLRHRSEVMTRFDTIGLRGLLAAHPDAVLEVPVQASAVLEDIDTPQDYERHAQGQGQPNAPIG